MEDGDLTSNQTNDQEIPDISDLISDPSKNTYIPYVFIGGIVFVLIVGVYVFMKFKPSAPEKNRPQNNIIIEPTADENSNNDSSATNVSDPLAMPMHAKVLANNVETTEARSSKYLTVQTENGLRYKVIYYDVGKFDSCINASSTIAAGIVAGKEVEINGDFWDRAVISTCSSDAFYIKLQG